MEDCAKEGRQRLTGPRSDIQLPGHFSAIAKNFKGLVVCDGVFPLAWNSIGLIEVLDLLH